MTICTNSLPYKIKFTNV